MEVVYETQSPSEVVWAEKSDKVVWQLGLSM
jgi:hypothetical protein